MFRKLELSYIYSTQSTISIHWFETDTPDTQFNAFPTAGLAEEISNLTVSKSNGLNYFKVY